MPKKSKTKDRENKELKEVENAYWKDLVNFIIGKWKENGTVSDEERTRDDLEAMLFLMSGYRFNCLIKTLCEVDDLMEEFNEKYSLDS